MDNSACVVFVNIDKKYLFIKKYDNKRELIRLLIILSHTPTPPILPLLIDGQNGIDKDSKDIKYWFSRISRDVMNNFNTYIKYPIHNPKNSNNK